MSALSRQISIRFAAIVIPAIAILAGLTGFLYIHDQTQEELLHKQAAVHLSDLQLEMVTREFRSIESDLRYLSEQSALKDFLTENDGARQTIEEEYVRFCRDKKIYDQIRFVDAEGQERIRVNYAHGRPRAVPDAELQPKATRYYFTETIRLDRGEVFVSPLDLNVEHEKIEDPIKPVLRLACPIFDRDGKKRGILILNYLGAELLTKLAAAASSFPGHAWVLNDKGHYLYGPPQEEWAFMYGRPPAFVTHYPVAWHGITATVQGQLLLPEGLFTYRAVSPRGARRPGARSSRASSLGSGPGGISDAANMSPGTSTLILASLVPSDRLRARSSELLTRLLLLSVAAGLVLSVLAVYLAYASALRRLHEARIEESESRLRTLSSRLLSAQEDERRRIARDLHDELGQIVTALRLNLDRVDACATEEKRKEVIGNARGAAACLLDRVHELTSQIRPPMLDDLGLKDATQSYLSEFESKFGIALRTELVFQRQTVPAAAAENAYRILQEALTNISKHAKTGDAWVQMHVTRDRLKLTVRDEGIGFRPEAVNGDRLGLLGIRERAELLGGEFQLWSEPGKGTEVRVNIPLAPN